MAEVNPWIVKAPKQMEQVPCAMYSVAFKGCEDFVMPRDGAKKWRFSWEVRTGEQAGKLATALTDQDISAKTLPGRLIAGLLGRPIVIGEDVQAAVAECVGKPYLVSVEPGPKGGKPGVKSCGKPPQM